MAQHKNPSKTSLTFDISSESPIDSRMLVDSVAALTTADNWKRDETPPYNGMTVTVMQTGEVYVLYDASADPNSPHYQSGHAVDVTQSGNWHNVGDSNKIIPRVKNELIYSDDNQTITTHQLMYQDVLVVDNADDFAACTQLSDIETDVLGTWQQFQSATWNQPYGANMPEYGNGTYVSDSGIGYGKWYTDASGGIHNDVNSAEFNGYIIPYAKNSYTIESLFGTDYGGTTGDQIGFSIVNDDNVSARHFSTEKRTYYRNTLYDIYPSGSTPSQSTVPIHPELSAWVNEDKLNNTAKVIYTVSPTGESGNTTEGFPSGDVSVYTINNIKTSAGRRNKPELPNDVETVVVGSTKNATGYIAFINVIVTNSTELQIAQYNNGAYTGTIYVSGSIYDVSTHTWVDTETSFINGNFDSRTSSDYWKSGYWLVPYNSELNTSNVPAVQKCRVSFNNGVLTMEFGNPISFANRNSATYNGSELKINFKTRSYDFKPYSNSGKDTKNNIGLPTFSIPSGKTIRDKDGNIVTPDLWGLFTKDTKFMYNAFSYEHLYIKCLGFTLDNMVFYADKTSSLYGVWELNSERTAYVKKQTGGVDDDPLKYFFGSRMSYNNITKKLFYNDGISIYQVAATPDLSHYRANPVLAATSTDTTNASTDTPNNSTYLNVVENGSVSGSIQIKGSEDTSVSAKDGVLTISSTGGGGTAVKEFPEIVNVITGGDVPTVPTTLVVADPEDTTNKKYFYYDKRDNVDGLDSSLYYWWLYSDSSVCTYETYTDYAEENDYIYILTKTKNFYNNSVDNPYTIDGYRINGVTYSSVEEYEHDEGVTTVITDDDKILDASFKSGYYGSTMQDKTGAVRIRLEKDFTVPQQNTYYVALGRIKNGRMSLFCDTSVGEIHPVPVEKIIEEQTPEGYCLASARDLILRMSSVKTQKGIKDCLWFGTNYDAPEKVWDENLVDYTLYMDKKGAHLTGIKRKEGAIATDSNDNDVDDNSLEFGGNRYSKKIFVVLCKAHNYGGDYGFVPGEIYKAIPLYVNFYLDVQNALDFDESEESKYKEEYYDGVHVDGIAPGNVPSYYNKTFVKYNITHGHGSYAKDLYVYK